MIRSFDSQLRAPLRLTLAAIAAIALSGQIIAKDHSSPDHHVQPEFPPGLLEQGYVITIKSDSGVLRGRVHRLLQALGPKKLSKKLLSKKGTTLRFFYPTADTEVTSQVAVTESLEFEFAPPPTGAEISPLFSARLMDQDKHHPLQTVAETRFALAVNDGTTATSYVSAYLGSSHFEIESTPGSVIQGLSASIRGRITTIDRDSKSQDKLYEHLHFGARFMWNGTVVNSIPAREIAPGESFEFVYAVQDPQPGAENLFSEELEIWREPKKHSPAQKLATFGPVSLAIPVIADTVAPTWAKGLPPSLNGATLREIPPLDLKIVDSFGRIDPASISVTLDGQERIASLNRMTQDQGRSYSITGDLNPLTVGPHAITVSGRDLAGNAAPVLSTQFEITPPITIVLGIQDGILTRKADLAVPVSIQSQESGAATVRVLINGDEVLSSQAPAVIAKVRLQEGLNVLEVRATDSQGNEAQPVVLSNIRLDTKPAEVFDLQPKLDEIVPSLNIPLSGRSSEKLRSVSVNGRQIAVSADGLSFSGTFAAANDAYFGLNWEVVDEAGNTRRVSYPVEVILQNPPPTQDLVAPVVYLSSDDNLMTNDPLFTLGVAVLDYSIPTTIIKHNGTQVYAGTATGFFIPLTLTSGVNTIEVSSQDAAGNGPTVVRLQNIVLDQGPPVLSFLQPSTGSDVTREFQVSGRSDKPLNYAGVNGTSLQLSPDRLTFTGTLLAPSTGALGLSWLAVDQAGNHSYTNSAVTVIEGSPQGPDNDPPVITVISPTEDIVHTNLFSYPGSVSISDASPVLTTFSINGQLILQTSQLMIDGGIPLMDFENEQNHMCGLRGGPSDTECTPSLNLAEIRAVDSEGNTAIKTIQFFVDQRQPQIFELSPASLSVLTSETVAVSGRADEHLQYARLNGSDLTLSADTLSFSGEIVFPSAGIYNLSWEISDTYGNITTQEYPIIIRTPGQDPGLGPVITLGVTNPYFTNQPELSVPVQITHPSSTLTVVTARYSESYAIEIYRTSQSSFTFHDQIRALPGPTVAQSTIYEIVSQDAYGNSTTESLIVQSDFEGPTGLVINPSPGSVFDQLTVAFSGEFNEELLSVRIDDQDLNVNLRSFSGPITFTGEGGHQVQLEATDIYGNSSSFSLSYFVYTGPSTSSILPSIRLLEPGPYLASQTLSVPIEVASEAPTLTVISMIDGNMQEVPVYESVESGFTAVIRADALIHINPMAILQGLPITFSVRSTDVLSNSADPAFFSALFDLTPPMIIGLSPSFQEVIPSLNIPVAGLATEPLSRASASLILLSQSPDPISSAELSISSDGKTFLGSLTAPGDENYNIQIQIWDVAGNTSSVQYPIIVNSNSGPSDTDPPFVIPGGAENLITRNSSYALPITVVDESATTTIVTVNGVEQASLAGTAPNATFIAQLTLSEGVNRIEILGQDEHGNTAAPVVLTGITLDSIAPAITLGVSDDQTLAVSAFDLPIQVTEAGLLVSVTVVQNNRQVYQSDSADFTASLILDRGINIITVTAVDGAGNTATAELSSIVLDDLPFRITVLSPSAMELVGLGSLAIGGISNRDLASVTLNGLALTVSPDLRGFSGTYSVSGTGIKKLTFYATATNGNKYITEIQVNAQNRPAPSGTGSSVISSASDIPDRLSDAFIDKTSLVTSLAARLSSRTDPATCTSSITFDPSPGPAGPEVQFDPMTEITPEIQSLANEVGDAAGAYFFVRDQIRFLPRFGALQTAQQVLVSGEGTAADKSSLLIALLRAQGAEAQYLEGELLVDEERLKNLFGVHGTYDLAWAMIMTLRGYFGQYAGTEGFDPEAMVQYVDGKRAWRLPHIWVNARITANGESTARWWQLDPVQGWMDYELKKISSSSPTPVSHVENLDPYCTPDQGAYCWPYLEQSQLGIFFNQSLQNENYSDYLWKISMETTSSALSANWRLGLSVAEQSEFIPEGPISQNLPCLRTQEYIVPDSFHHLVWTRFSEDNIEVDTLLLKHHLALATGTLLTRTGVALSTNTPEGVHAYTLSSATSSLQITHALIEPAAYGALAESRTIPPVSGDKIVHLSSSASPISFRHFEESLHSSRILARVSSNDAELGGQAMRTASIFGLMRASEIERDIEDLRMSRRTPNHLMTLITSVTGASTSLVNSVGIGVQSGTIDWQVGGASYAYFGENVEISAYHDLAQAKGDATVAHSSTEQQIWEEVLGLTGHSAVTILKEVAASESQMIAGDELTTESSPFILARLTPAMQSHFSQISHLATERPFIYAPVDMINIDGTPSAAIVIYPRSAKNTAATYYSRNDSGLLLGGEGLAPLPQSGPEFSPDNFSTSCSGGTKPDDAPEGSTYRENATCNIRSTESTPPSSTVYATQCDNCWYRKTEDSYQPYGGQGTYVENGDEITYSCQGPCDQSYISILSDSYPGWDQYSGGGVNPPPGTQTPNGQPGNSKSPSSCPASPTTSVAGQPVNLHNGAMWHEFVDISLEGKNTASPIEFKRTYVAFPSHETNDFGPHWSHNWETRLYVKSFDDPNTLNIQPDLLWVDESGGMWTFHGEYPGAIRELSTTNLRYKITELEDRWELLDVEQRILYTFSRQEPLVGLLLSKKGATSPSINLTYDSSGRLTSINSGKVGRLRIDRNADGLISSIVRERDGLAYTYSYTSGWLTTFTALGQRTQNYEYNPGQVGTRAYGLLSAIVDPLGRRIEFEYYDNGRAYRQFEAGGGSYTFFYSASTSPSVTRVRATDGEMTEYRFNSFGQNELTIYPDGSRRATFWEKNSGLPVLMSDELGHGMAYFYNFDARVSRVQTALGRKAEYTYDFATGAIKRIIRGGFLEEQRTLNPSTGNVTAISRSDSNDALSMSLTYDSYGNILGVNNGQANYTNSRNSDGNLSTVYDARNPETRSYDARKRLETRTWSTGRTLTYVYNDFDQVTSITDSHGPNLTMDYDDVGRLISRTLTDNDDSQTTTYTWDDRDRLQSVTDANDRTVQFKYSSYYQGCQGVRDVPTEITDPAGRITRMSYDKRGRLTRTESPDGRVTRYEYNLRGDLIALTDAAGNRTQFSYDADRRLIRQERPTAYFDATLGDNRPGIEVTKYHYDSADRLILEEKLSASSSPSLYKQYTWDAADRLTRVRQGYGSANFEPVQWDPEASPFNNLEEQRTFTYEPRLDSVSLKTATNGVATLGFTHESTPPFAMTGYTVSATDPANPWGLIQDAFTLGRHPTGGIASITSLSAGPTPFWQADYDPAGRLKTIAAHLPGMPPDPIYELQATLSYDGFGRRRTLSHNTGLTGTWSYDDLNRITGTTWVGSDRVNGVPLNFSQQLYYDPLKDVITDQVREFGNFHYRYDKDNQLASVHYSGTKALPSEIVNRTFAYDKTGNRMEHSVIANTLIEDPSFTYTLDMNGWGQPTERRDVASGVLVDAASYTADGKMKTFENGAHFVEYARDALGRRVAKRITPKHGDPTFTQGYLHLADQDKVLLAKDGEGSLHLYIDGENIDEHLGHVGPNGAHTYATDHLGSVINSSLAGETNTFGPFGETLASSPSLSITSQPVCYGFTGREFDLESGKYHYRARAYDPLSGRFTSVDPLGYFAGDTNLYRYVGNNPIEYTDPFGLISAAECRKEAWRRDDAAKKRLNDAFNLKKTEIEDTIRRYNQELSQCTSDEERRRIQDSIRAQERLLTGLQTTLYAELAVMTAGTLGELALCSVPTP